MQLVSVCYTSCSEQGSPYQGRLKAGSFMELTPEKQAECERLLEAWGCRLLRTRAASLCYSVWKDSVISTQSNEIKSSVSHFILRYPALLNKYEKENIVLGPCISW